MWARVKQPAASMVTRCSGALPERWAEEKNVLRQEEFFD
jgi:hypothetical protein